MDSLENTVTAPARIYFLLARLAPVGVIFRRGPRRHVQLIKWNLRDDTFEPGQWLKGRIYERRSDLSPDGSLLGYFGSKQWSRPVGTETWTAISRPPYLTALSFWFKGGTWAGGGLFESNDHFKLNDGGPQSHRLAETSVLPPIKVSILGAGQGEDDPIELLRLLRDGWQLRQDLKVSSGSLPSEAELEALDPQFKNSFIAAVRQVRGKRRLTMRGSYRYARNKGYRTEQPRLLEKFLDKEGAIRLQASVYLFGYHRVWAFEVVSDKLVKGPDLAGVDWAEWDMARNRLVYVKEGSLYVWQPGQEEAHNLADFNLNRFEYLAAPEWAKQW